MWQLGSSAVAAAAWRRRWQYGGGSAAAVAEVAAAWWWWWRGQFSSNACAFERHRHANVRAFVLGQGWRDDGADCVIVGNSGARGDVYRGRRGADKVKGDADDTIC
jgi:hypothetical protein